MDAWLVVENVSGEHYYTAFTNYKKAEKLYVKKAKENGIKKSVYKGNDAASTEDGDWWIEILVINLEE